MAKKLETPVAPESLKRTVRVDLTSADRKKMAELMPGEQIGVFVQGEIVDLNWHKGWGPKDTFAGFMTLEVKALEMGQADASEVAELFSDEMDDD